MVLRQQKTYVFWWEPVAMIGILCYCNYRKGIGKKCIWFNYNQRKKIHILNLRVIYKQTLSVIFVVTPYSIFLNSSCTRRLCYDPPCWGEVKLHFMANLYDLLNYMFDGFPLIIQNMALTWFLASVIPVFHTEIISVSWDGESCHRKWMVVNR